MDEEPLRRELDALRDEVRRVGRAVLAARTEAAPADARADDVWATGLLPAVDALDRCARTARTLGEELGAPRKSWLRDTPGDPRVATLAEALTLAGHALADLLAARGYRLDRPDALPFDPARHRAVATAPGPEGQVVETARVGLWHGERRLREAEVILGAPSTLIARSAP